MFPLRRDPRAITREDVYLAAISISEAGSAPLHPATGSNGPQAGDTLLAAISASLDDAKAEDVAIIDIKGKTTLADTMAIASGRSNTHVGAIAERIIKAVKEAGLPAPRVEGMPHNDWVLVDAGDVIVHIFRPEVRRFYNLEKMWGADRPGEKRVS
jgi:ribosome-associated protein